MHVQMFICAMYLYNCITCIIIVSPLSWRVDDVTLTECAVDSLIVVNDIVVIVVVNGPAVHSNKIYSQRG